MSEAKYETNTMFRVATRREHGGTTERRIVALHYEHATMGGCNWTIFHHTDRPPTAYKSEEIIAIISEETPKIAQPKDIEVKITTDPSNLTDGLERVKRALLDLPRESKGWMGDSDAD